MASTGIKYRHAVMRHRGSVRAIVGEPRDGLVDKRLVAVYGPDNHRA
jgi:hypothetical protein